MNSEQFDAFSRLLASSSSRRAALRRLGVASVAAAGLRAVSRSGSAQEATPAASSAISEAQAALDALDPDTRDSIARALWQTELRAEDLEPDILAKILDPKNSNEAFGLRNGAHLLSLIAEPTSFVQSYAPRYETLLPYCESLSPHQAYIMANLMGPEAAKGYRPLPPVADFQFPQNNAMDLESQLGWYFFVGSAQGSDGEEYGMELMYFRYALLPPDLATSLGLTAVENQIIELHVALAKAGDRLYQATPILVAGTTGLLTFESDGLGATIGKTTIRSLEDDALFPVQIQAWGQDDGGLEPVQLGFDLTFSSGRDYLMQGDDGCGPCCDGVGTLYYSVPGLVLDPSVSTVTLHGETIPLTEGIYWFDHQWGMLSAIPQSEVVRASSNLAPPSSIGWDWFEAQFGEDRQITANSIHSNDFSEFYQQQGVNPPGTMTVPVAAKYMDRDEAVHDISGTLSVTDWILSVDTADPVMYPPTYTWYPNRWEFTFGEEVPEDIRSFVMVPIVETGQSHYFASGAQYSEGAVYLLDPAGNEIGRGFAESVGYANTLSNMLRLVGIPATDDMLGLFSGNPPDEGMVLASQAFAYLHATELEEALGACLGL